MKHLLLTLAWMATAALAEVPSFQFRSPDKSHLIWTDGTMHLAKPKRGPYPKLGYAVLKAKHSLALQSILPKDFSLAPMTQSLDLNYYLVPIDHVDQLEALASLAHTSTGMCGSIEWLGLNSTVASSNTILPPIFGATAVFEDLKSLTQNVSLNQLDQTVDTLAALPSRYHRHPQGQTAHTTVRQLWENQMLSNRWTITEVSQSLSGQKSIVATLPGLKNPSETVIIGAHLDSTISRSGDSNTGVSPGADDDASGIAALTEILRLIETSQLTFDRSIELQAYAAEEVGLVGSRAIAADYAAAGRKIAGMYQIDMAYYSSPGASGIIHILEEYSSRDLRRMTVDLIRGYLGPIYKFGHLPKGSASDHKSFYDQGFPTVFAFEDPVHYNPQIHTGDDNRRQFDDGLLLKRITQLALLFTAHQAGLQSLSAGYEELKSALLPSNLAQKIKIAVQKADSSYYLAASAPLEATTLEFCQIEDGTIPHCVKERETLDMSSSLTTRKIFYSKATWALEPGQKWRVLAYDEADALIAWRQFILNSP